ncbi:hypothetical protein EN829_024165 [Mesorhizobium sp. M00.F.Ca.ET.186.01.1.1]|nr:hypothetical protein EN848_19230 [bacterium M00.F.Ca.ET.205.01.1.1]TGU51877.1 hypothetical protein EN795_18780 [bacterium M00.F.Ca.ET.152.01.1.1]TGV33275.1 hypothetical protein EN829_024165 [Mesorhizobium sp. M00.F.Ca.ET.186.01.1.1]TGZ42416.1 hypothetical protein EN805_14510 [bacterium M00.F.Ca.ET.162.01.1.1]TIW60733.1 MAG: hypothetical protein E5V48_12455 [Mesorhizobium sp.]
MGTKTNIGSWFFRISITAAAIGGAGMVAGGPVAKLAAMGSGEISTLHAALFCATVWIVSSLRIARLKALWRVGLRLLVLRGPSGNLLLRGPKARAAAGGSVGGAGTSGVS